MNPVGTMAVRRQNREIENRSLRYARLFSASADDLVGTEILRFFQELSVV